MRLLVAVLICAALSAPASPASAGAELPVCEGQPATITEPDEHGVFRGTPDDDVIVGSLGNDLIVGRAGDDILCGRDGDDRLVGGKGADRLFGEAENHADDETPLGDVLDGGPGDDHVDGNALATVVFRTPVPRAGIAVDLAARSVDGQGHDTLGPDVTRLEGTPRPDFFLGDDRNNEFLGGTGGGDEFHGRGGRDQFTDGLGSAHGPDRVLGGPGDDFVWSTRGRDLVEGGAGDDSLHVSGGRADGGKGEDRVGVTLARGRTPRLVGGAGHDVVGLELGDAAVDIVTDLRAGRVRVPAWQTAFRVDGFGEVHVGGDAQLTWTATGTRFDEWFGTDDGIRLVVHAGGGDDTVLGSRRGDRIHGGPGRDTARALSGRDRCTSVEVLPYDDCERVP